MTGDSHSANMHAFCNHLWWRLNRILPSFIMTHWAIMNHSGMRIALSYDESYWNASVWCHLILLRWTTADPAILDSILQLCINHVVICHSTHHLLWYCNHMKEKSHSAVIRDKLELFHHSWKHRHENTLTQRHIGTHICTPTNAKCLDILQSNLCDRGYVVLKSRNKCATNLHVYIYIWTYIYVYINVHICIYMCTNVNVYTNIYTNLFMYICRYVYTYLYILIHIYYIQIHIQIYIYIIVDMHIHICTYIYIYIICKYVIDICA